VNNPLKLNISATAGGTVTGNYTLAATKVGSRTPTSCPGFVSAGGSYTYELVELKNNTARTATVSAWLSGATEIDTAMAVYPNNLPPSSETQLNACNKADDDCDVAPCTGLWSGLQATGAFNLAPGQAVVVRFGSYFETTAPGKVTTGPVTLTVKTDSFL
jgi:hypothetical protein